MPLLIQRLPHHNREFRLGLPVQDLRRHQAPKCIHMDEFGRVAPQSQALGAGKGELDHGRSVHRTPPFQTGVGMESLYTLPAPSAEGRMQGLEQLSLAHGGGMRTVAGVMRHAPPGNDVTAVLG